MHDGLLIAGGFLPMTGVETVNGIARWNGSWWSGLGSGLSPTTSHQAMVLTVFEGDLIAGGSFTHAGGVPVNSIARWNGIGFSPP